MLRRLGQPPAGSPEPASDETALPSLDQSFALEDRPAGVRFYKGRESFFHPYALLESMTFGVESLTLSFSSADVIISGRGLHALYVHLASHRVARVVEQGERYLGASEAATFITRIDQTAK